MYTVFLSSTYKDLIEHRKAVIDAINSLGNYKCVCMEQFGSRNASAAEFCSQAIEDCDLFVGILGHLYGSIDPKTGKSFTEIEFAMARRLSKHRLIFLSHEEAAMPMIMVEADEYRARQAKLRRENSTERIRDTFTTPESLSGRVLLAIRNWEDSSKERDRLTRPLPPQPSFEHPYPLQENFTGRKQERKLLTSWLTQDSNPILSVTAIGGMGKSALVWAWLQRDVLGLPLPGTLADADPESSASGVSNLDRPSGVFWWSFYEGESSFGSFLDAALYYATRGKSSGSQYQLEGDKSKALAASLQREQILLVLDGFERQLTAYASLNAAYQGDEVDDRDREFVEPVTRDFFRHFLSALGQSRILITTRLTPIDLENRAGFRKVELGTLSPEDAEAFLRSQGVHGASVDIRAACETYGYHALALRLLAGYVVNHPVYPGDIRTAPEYDANDRLVAKDHHVLELAYNALGESERLLLSQLAAFRFPVNYATLEKTLCVTEREEVSRFQWRKYVNLLGGKSQLRRRKELRSSLSQLLSRGLVFFDRVRGSYDLHPIVRHYAYDRLSDKKGIHTRYVRYYQLIPANNLKSEPSIEDLASVIELYHHTVRAKLYDHAFQLFTDRLQEPLLKNLCAVHLYKSLIDALIPPGAENGIRLSGLLEARALACRAHSLRLSGNNTQALAAYDEVIAIYEHEKSNREIYVTFLHSGLAHFAVGKLQAAERMLWKAVKGCNEYGERGYCFLAQEFLLQLYALEGLQQEFQKLASATRSLPLTFNRIEADVYVAMFEDNLDEAIANARRALDLALKKNYEMDKIRAKCLLGTMLARQCLDTATSILLPEAETLLRDSQEQCLSVGLIESEADARIGFGWWYLAAGDPIGARESLSRAKMIAENSCYRIKLALIHWAFAEIDLLENDTASAKTNLARARELACCGEPPWRLTPFITKLDKKLSTLQSRSAKAG